MTCNISNCGQPISCKGLCKSHYLRKWHTDHPKYNEKWRSENPQKVKNHQDTLLKKRKTPEGKIRATEVNDRWYRRKPATTIWHGAKARAKEKGILFEITPEDIVVPDKCPILGIELFISEKGVGRTDNSPSLDRIIPSLGYVKGNIAVISQRANRIKNDATLEEITKLKAWLEIKGGSMRGTDLPATLPEVVTPVLAEGVDFNIPLSDAQKLTITNIRLRRSTIQRQIAELQTQDAKLEGFFPGELMKIAFTNKIDMENFVLSDNLEIKPKDKNPRGPQLRA